MELHSYSELALRGIGQLHAHHVPCASPFRGFLAGHFLRHFQQHFHDLALAQGVLVLK
jgi:hypothetical protein